METASIQIQDEIVKWLESNMSLNVVLAKPINRGYRNYKWIFTLLNGEQYFVKQYHPDRFSPSKLQEVEVILCIQKKLSELNSNFPKPLSYQGRHILSTTTGIYFTVMEFSEGSLIKPGTANTHQMYHLGRTLGFMHYHLNNKQTGKSKWHPDRKEIEEKWDNYWTNAQLNQSDGYVLDALSKQKNILDKMHFPQFDNCKAGWTHWDLWVDNILFHDQTVSSILDFDRMRFVYPELDISRALLSCTYSVSDGMDWQGIDKFLEGYNEYLSFTAEDLTRALRLTWCQESVWWITHDIEHREENPKRFFQEIMWITDHWDLLGEMLKDRISI